MRASRASVFCYKRVPWRLAKLLHPRTARPCPETRARAHTTIFAAGTAACNTYSTTYYLLVYEDTRLEQRLVFQRFAGGDREKVRQSIFKSLDQTSIQTSNFPSYHLCANRSMSQQTVTVTQHFPEIPRWRSWHAVVACRPKPITPMLPVHRRSFVPWSRNVVVLISCNLSLTPSSCTTDGLIAAARGSW